MKRFLPIFAALCLLAAPLASQAALFSAEESVHLGQATDSDAYLAGGIVTVAESVNGDLFAAGASVNSSGAVAQDLFAGGSSVIVTSAVGDDARVAGSNVVISGNISDELFAAGSFVQVSSSVGGDAHVAGAAVILDGTVSGDLFLAAADATIGGTVEGNILAYVEDLHITENARIAGTLTYYAETEQDLSGINAGSVVYAGPAAHIPEFEKHDNGPFGFLAVVGIIKLLGLFIAGLLLGLLFPRTALHLSKDYRNSFWSNLLTGLVAAIVIPVLTGMLFLTVIGWPFAIVMIPAVIILSVLSSVYTGIAIGTWVVSHVRKKAADVSWLTITVGFLLLLVLSVIPILGWVVALALYLSMVGLFIRELQRQFKKMN